jgi:hypothetical protein
MQVTARATKWLGIEETGGIIEQNNYQNQKATAVFLPSAASSALPLFSTLFFPTLYFFSKFHVIQLLYIQISQYTSVVLTLPELETRGGVRSRRAHRDGGGGAEPTGERVMRCRWISVPAVGRVGIEQ